MEQPKSMQEDEALEGRDTADNFSAGPLAGSATPEEEQEERDDRNEEDELMDDDDE